MLSTWMGDYSSVEVDAVVKNTVKISEWRKGPSKCTPEAKKRRKKFSRSGLLAVCLGFYAVLKFAKLIENVS